MGQLSMGFIGDYLGRNTGLAFTMAIATIGSLLSTAAPTGDAVTENVMEGRSSLVDVR